MSIEVNGVQVCEDPNNCSVHTAISLIGNKWKAYIIHDLLLGKKRFGQLQRDIHGISQKVLTDNLRAMEADGLLTRTVYPEVPPRVEYELSELGKSFCPVLASVAKWGDMYRKKVQKGEITPRAACPGKK